MVVWAEIPYISEHMPNGRENTISQMKELIIQNYNHPCIVCWGVSNEITISTKDKKDMLDNHRQLNDLCHEMDKTRLTTLACYAMCGPFNRSAHITDMVSWNLYLGWYVPGFILNDLWMGFFHLCFPNRPFGYSEYGAEGMPNLHSTHPHRGDHTEEYQAKYHEYMLRCFKRHPWMWATHVWNMFDFAADARDQGGEPGMNHKGLVTFDRKTKKDSFYLYKAWWSDEAFVHICSKRFVERTGSTATVKVYTVENTDGRMTADGNVALTYKWTNAALDSTTFATSETGTAITNLFDEADPNKSSSEPGEVTWLSRSNWVATFPTQPVVLNATQTLADHLAFTRYDGSKADSVEMPTLGADNGLALVSMIGADYDDPQWDTLLDQLTFNEMVNTITLGFHNTAAIESIGKTRTKDENGPQGLTAALTGGASAMCYTSEDVMAATFNVDLINDVGRCIGEDCLAMGYSGLYGPGINMHRTAYSGRNFEYYASDPFVAGTICAAEVNGIQSKGVYVYLKHVALNDSESSRRGVNTWLNEQAAREIYLEVANKAITDGGAWSVMTGFNRWGAYWCGAYDNLLTGFLRGELGMRGMIITDYSGSSKYMDLADGLIAGSDIWDSPDPTIHTTLAPKYENDAYIVTEMRESMHKILYTVANSNAMNGWSSADRLKVITPWWKTALYALDTVLAVLTVLCIWRLVVAIKRKKTWTAEQAANTASAQNQQ